MSPPRLLVSALRRTLLEPSACPLPPPGAKHAAVLVPLFDASCPPVRRLRCAALPLERQHAPEASTACAGGLGVLLTRRTRQLSTHGGEVALPGGRIDGGETPTQAALREAHEEVGLDPRAVSVVGLMKPMLSKHNVWVTPVVGYIEQAETFAPRPNPGEVESVFWVELTSMLSTDGHTSDDIVIWEHTNLRIHSFDHAVDASRVWPPPASSPAERFRIWGLTSAILVLVAMWAH